MFDEHSGWAREAHPPMYSEVKRSAAMQPREVVEDWVKAFNKADIEGLVSLYTADATNHQVAESPVKGRDAMPKMFVREFAAGEMVGIVEHIFQVVIERFWNGAIPRGTRVRFLP
jgi:ketosteroid isomerase-like protein